MGPIAMLVHDDPYLKMSREDRLAARKARKERFFPRNFEAEIRLAQAIETPLLRSPEPAKVEPPCDPFKEWMDRWKARQMEDLELPKCPDVRTIQRACCEHFKITLLDVLSIRRTANVVLPRQIAMYLCKTITMKSLPDIGRRFGGRDHTTVLHAVRKIEAKMAADEKFAALVNDLKQQLAVA